MDIIKTTTQLAEVLAEKNLGSITVKNREVEICLESKYDGGVPSNTTNHYYGSSPVASVPAAVVPTALEPQQQPEVKQGNYVTSPIVGTFYSKPAPDKPPFVNVGDKVKKGQVICIVESMKLMNEINSEFEGTVAAILAMDGDAVDFGKELIQIV
ncbi:MAG: acetyl-CoA carboxylase biotin carboxyl carrier protein [Oscillospiraceae bacterium]|nr:acetyl-CoA carboxylase biotin carboxyl carrier protein [Oscillospiraceae bacterium]